jgi:hypothetical protein
MEYSAGCCCGDPSPCPCSSAYTSITVKWNGFVRLDPMNCVEYNKQNLEVQQSTGFDISRCRLQSRMEPLGSVLYGSISHTFLLQPSVCTYYTFREMVVQQRSRYVSPSCAGPSNPLGYPCEPGRICANELVFDAFYRIYRYRIGYELSLYLPQAASPPFIPARPKWGVQIKFSDSHYISFRSTDPDFSCNPTTWQRESIGFDLDYNPPAQNNADGAKCWPVMSVGGSVDSNTGSTFQFEDLTPDPDWSTYIHPPSTCYVATFDLGSVRVG